MWARHLICMCMVTRFYETYNRTIIILSTSTWRRQPVFGLCFEHFPKKLSILYAFVTIKLICPNLYLSPLEPPSKAFLFKENGPLANVRSSTDSEKESRIKFKGKREKGGCSSVSNAKYLCSDTSYKSSRSTLGKI